MITVKLLHKEKCVVTKFTVFQFSKDGEVAVEGGEEHAAKCNVLCLVISAKEVEVMQGTVLNRMKDFVKLAHESSM